MRRASLTLIAVLLAAGVISAQDDGPPLEVVLERAGRYVAEYQKGLRGIVAEEEYLPNSTSSRGSPDSPGPPSREGRQLKSDLSLVKPGAEARWMPSPNVFEVDKTPFRDRDQPLYTLSLAS